MKSSVIEKILASLLLVILAGIVVHAPLTVYFGTLFTEQDLLIKAWKELLMVPAAILAGMIVYRRRLWRQLANDRLVWFMAAYVLLHGLTLFVFWTGWSAVLAGLAIDLRFIGYFGLVYILLLAAPQWRRRFVCVAVAGAVIVIGFGVLQLFLPHDILRHIGYDKSTTIAPYLTVDQNYDYIRINSTLRGPNPLGAYAAIVVAGLAAAVTTGRLNLRHKKALIATSAAIVASLAVLWVSYSRSALGGTFIAVVLVAMIAYAKLIHKYLWISLAAVLLLISTGVYLARDSDLVSHVILHEDPNEGNDVNSNDGHIESLVYGIERMAAQPFGAGVGSTGSASLLTGEPTIIENHYLFIAHEIGWLGLALFVGIFGLVLWRLWHLRSDWLAVALFASGVGLAAIGMLLPVWVDDTVALVWWGLAAVALATSNQKEKRHV